jgi:hypothetical protein
MNNKKKNIIWLWIWLNKKTYSAVDAEFSWISNTYLYMDILNNNIIAYKLNMVPQIVVPNLFPCLARAL